LPGMNHNPSVPLVHRTKAPMKLRQTVSTLGERRNGLGSPRKKKKNKNTQKKPNKKTKKKILTQPGVGTFLPISRGSEEAEKTKDFGVYKLREVTRREDCWKKTERTKGASCPMGTADSHKGLTKGKYCFLGSQCDRRGEGLNGKEHSEINED